MPRESYRYQSDIQVVLEPWRQHLGPDYDRVASLLKDRDRRVEDLLDQWLSRHGMRCSYNATTALPANTWTFVTFSTPDGTNDTYDEGGNFFSNGYTVPRDGLYRIESTVHIEPTAAAATYAIRLRTGAAAADQRYGNQLTLTPAGVGQVLSVHETVPQHRGDRIGVEVNCTVAQGGITSFPALGLPRLVVARVGPLP